MAAVNSYRSSELMTMLDSSDGRNHCATTETAKIVRTTAETQGLFYFGLNDESCFGHLTKCPGVLRFPTWSVGRSVERTDKRRDLDE